ncbi:MAG: hypothetical protein K6T92_09700, partial [Candidatus Rokubacteria bacterium]|nr:hypothetical protein [Candidatus Rokubacteria bacterium]
MLTDPAWTTDGRGLVYGRLLVSDDLRTARFELILKQSLDSERILAAWPWRRRTPTLDEQARRCVAISSSGSWVVAPDPDAPGLVLIERPSGRVARHLDNACRPSWSPETDWLAFVRDSDPPRVELLDPAASEPLVLATLPGLGPSGFPSPFWSPDESSVSLLVPAGPPDGPFALRLERFRVDPPGPEPAWLLNEPPAPSLAPDAAALADLRQAVRQWLAWSSIDRDRETLGLDAFQIRQVEERLREADETVDLRVAGTYQWVL